MTDQTGTGTTPWWVFVLIMAPGLIAISCGADEPVDPELGGGSSLSGQPAVDGIYFLSALEVDGDDQLLGGPVAVEIESEFATLNVDTGCGRQLGSFSLFDDGTAGVTIAGGSTATCDEVQATQEQYLLAALDQVDRWSDDGTTIELRTASGDSVALSR